MGVGEEEALYCVEDGRTGQVEVGKEEALYCVEDRGTGQVSFNQGNESLVCDMGLF